MATEAIAPGVVVDGFRIEERLHRGGMATLWRVTRVDGDEAMPLLMKVPRIGSGEEPAAIVGFEVERMILPTLSGPHVPRFVARGDDPARPWLVMERIPGDTLRARLDAAPLPPLEVAAIGARVALALHDVHRQHVVHLDVKPSNVLFRPGGEAVLIDFGLSRHERLPDLLEEEFELPMGTAPYMSPEQVQFVRDDPRSDLFALGVMLYHLLTGTRPFGHLASVRGLRQRLYRAPVPPRALRPDCPPWLQEVVLRCLEVDPDRRHPSAAQLAFDLQHPDQVALGERATRLASPGRWQSWRRWAVTLGSEPKVARSTEQAARSPFVLAAIDVAGGTPRLLEAMQAAVQAQMQAMPGARLACLAVMRTNRIGMDELMDPDGSSRHVNLLVQLKHWARPVVKALAITGQEQDARVTFHVLEAPDAAGAIVDYARRNRVDHIVMGARSSSALRRYLGSVSSEVVAQADCTVTVVRAADAAR